jgi:hypothetical protein
VLFLIVIVSLLIDSRRKKYWKLILLLILFVAVTASYYHLPRKMKVLDNHDLVASYRFYSIPENINNINLMQEDSDYLFELLNNTKVTRASKSYVSLSENMIEIGLFSLENQQLIYTLNVNQETGQVHLRDLLKDKGYTLKAEDDLLDYIVFKNEVYNTVVLENPDHMILNTTIREINDTEKHKAYEISIDLPEGLQITEVYLYSFNWKGASHKLYLENISENIGIYKSTFELSTDERIIESRTKVYIRGFQVHETEKEMFQDIVGFELWQ